MKRFLSVMVIWLAGPGMAPLAASQKPSAAHYEMTTYYLVLLYRGPNSTGETTPQSQRIQDAHMANIGRMADEGKLEVSRCQRGLVQRRPDARDQHRLQRIDTGLQVVGGSSTVRSQHPPTLVDQQEVGLGAAAVDAEVGLHLEGFQG